MAISENSDSKLSESKITTLCADGLQIPQQFPQREELHAMDEQSGGVARLTYKSTSLIELASAYGEVQSLLNAARNANKAKEITGVLLSYGNNFAQLLEGPSKDIGSLYAKISADTRHEDVTLIGRTENVKRAFSDWSMMLAGDAEGADIPLFVSDTALAEGAVWKLDKMQQHLLSELREAVTTEQKSRH